MIPEFELVVPAWNEAPSLPALVERFAEAAGRAGFTSDRFRLVLVDNGSTDGTATTIAGLCASPLGPWLNPVRIDVNRGYGNGLWVGLGRTTAEVVGWTHADLQCDPADAFRALAKLRAEGTQKALIKGRRVGRAWRDVAVSRTFELVASVVLGLRATEMNAQPKVFARTLLASFRDPPTGFAFDAYALYAAARAGLRIESIDVRFSPRRHGVSKWAATLPGRARTMAGVVRAMRNVARTEGRL